jgi:predicted lipid-binding transport protein (Tim44 family)
VKLFKARDNDANRLQSFVLAAAPGALGSAIGVGGSAIGVGGSAIGVGGGDVDVAAVQRVDATFDPTIFLAGATSLFSDVRAALSAGSIDPVAGRLSPELTAMFGNQLQYATTSGHQLTMTSIDQVTASLRGVEAGSAGDIGCLVRYDVVGRMGVVALGGSEPPASQLAAMPQRPWFENWRLTRPAGLASPPLPATCPSCGAPTTGGTHCPYCHALLVDATVAFRVEHIECMG